MNSLARILNNEKGVVFVVALVYVALALLFIGGYMNMTSSEYRITKLGNDNIKAFYQAEAGANRGLAELKKRIETDMVTRMRGINLSNRSIISNYQTANDSLGFLRDYAYAAAQPQFAVSGSQAALSIPGLTGFNYSGQIIVITNGNPSYNAVNDAYIFPYRYNNVFAQGMVSNAAKRVDLSGTFTVTVFPQSFASYALFTNQQRSASGSTIWFINSTNFSGPVHTNGRFNFALNPSGTFTGLATQVQSTAQFYNNGWPVLLNADRNGNLDVPAFQAGFTRSYGNVPMPTTVSKDTQRRKALGLADGASIPTYGNGIYVPNNAGAVSGGIYVQGNSTVATSVSGNNAIYTITQGSTTQNITVNHTTNQTTVQTVGGGTNTYSGKPNGMIFTNDGSITSLSGTVQKDSQVTVAATSDVIFTNNMRYEEYTAGNPPNAQGKTNVLGVMSWDGNVRVATSAPNNLDLHATVMAPNGEFKVDNYNTGSSRGTCTLLGGAITNTYGAFGTFGGGGNTGYGRNFVYDSRMSQGVAPPFFPILPNFDASESGLDNKPGWSEN